MPLFRAVLDGESNSFEYDYQRRTDFDSFLVQTIQTAWISIQKIGAKMAGPLCRDKPLAGGRKFCQLRV